MTVACLWPGASSHAHGRPIRLTAVGPDQAPFTFDLELGLAAGEADPFGNRSVTAFAPYAALGYVFGEAIELELTLPFALLLEQPQPPVDERGLLAGNPAIGLHHVDRAPDGSTELRIGAVLALPAGGSNDEVAVGELSGHGYLMAMNGGREAWLYLPEAIGIALPIRYERHSGLALYGCDLSLVAIAGGALTSLIELAPLAGVKSGAFSAGARFQVAWLPFSSEGDALLSLAPFAQVELSRLVFSYTRFVLNLDEPVGLAAEGPTVWGLFLGTGARL